MRQAEHAIYMGRSKNSYKILVRKNLKETDHLGNLSNNGSIILKRILKK
jgi:hypothetical protein